MAAKRVLLPVAVVFLLALGALPIAGSKSSTAALVVPAAKLVWSPAGIPGVSTAAVSGDMTKGPSRFYLRYAAGLITPLHHHSPDHYVTTVSGELVLVANGSEQRLAPGSYFALTGKAPHAARCESRVDCVMFIEADGAWDVVPESAKP